MRKQKHKLLFGLISCIGLITTWVFADSTYVESDELLDAYLEDEARTVTYPSRSAANQGSINQTINTSDSVNFIGDDGIEYRRVESVDGTEIYEAVPANSAKATSPATETSTLPDVEISQETQVSNVNELEVIELEPADGEYVEIEAPQEAVNTNTNEAGQVVIQGSGHSYCQQNPYARECLLSDYVTRCKTDPQSTDCKSQLEKFDRFCGTFPRAYKCRKAEIAATCKEQPNLNECKPFAERYCQRYPKAVFCNYN